MNEMYVMGIYKSAVRVFISVAGDHLMLPNSQDSVEELTLVPNKIKTGQMNIVACLYPRYKITSIIYKLPDTERFEKWNESIENFNLM